MALGGADLTSPACKMTMGLIAAVAEFERDLLIDGNQSGHARAKTQGITLGITQSVGEDAIKTVEAPLAQGEAVAALVRDTASVDIPSCAYGRLDRR
jgi:putative DNA-invertase from lambdoid prophage Rac